MLNFYILDLFSRTTGTIITKVGKNVPYVKGIQNSSNEGHIPSQRQDDSKRDEYTSLLFIF
jgi:hypothetical protein